MQFSILICSVQSRVNTRADLINDLRRQIGSNYEEANDTKEYIINKYIGAQAEVIICTDNKQMSVGAKRNLLIAQASGSYIAFIDDDDRVAASYVNSILDKLVKKPDVVVFNAMRFQNGKPDRGVIYGIEYTQDINRPNRYYRMPNHLMVIKKSIAEKIKFKPISFGEDADFAKRIRPYLRHEERIYDCLYEYWFDSNKTETQKQNA